MKAKPNQGHFALAELAKTKGRKCLTVSQNIDGEFVLVVRRFRGNKWGFLRWLGLEMSLRIEIEGVGLSEIYLFELRGIL